MHSRPHILACVHTSTETCSSTAAFPLQKAAQVDNRFSSALCIQVEGKLHKAEKQIVELQQRVSEQLAIILAYEVDTFAQRSQHEATAALTKVPSC